MCITDDTRIAARASKSDHGTEVYRFAVFAGMRVFFIEKEIIMPRNNFQRAIFALLTVIVTVHAYVFYSLYVVHGDSATNVLDSINAQGGVMMMGGFYPIWLLVIIEVLFAFTLEMLVGSPLSFKLACKVFDPKTTHPVLFETALICATVGIMCPAMSFIAAWLYFPYQFMDFSIIKLLANWLELMCYNFPFAFFTQLFFIQPLIRTVFKFIFRKDIATRESH